MPQKDKINKLITINQRRLQKLREQQALKGTNTEPEVLIEIEDLEAKIKEQQIELDRLEDGEKLSSQTTASLSDTSTKETTKNNLKGDARKSQKFETVPQIFLSYAREDREKVEYLYQKLSKAGLKPWMDVRNLLPGQRWKFQIKKNIRQSDFFLFCLSASSINKQGFLQNELQDALDVLQEKDYSDIYLIPVRLEECEVPENLREIQWADIFEEYGWGQLIQAIQVGTARREAPGSIEVQESLKNSSQLLYEIQSFPKKIEGRKNSLQAILKNITSYIKKKFFVISRDPVWQMIGVIVAVISFGWGIYVYNAGESDSNPATPPNAAIIPTATPAEIVIVPTATNTPTFTPTPTLTNTPIPPTPTPSLTPTPIPTDTPIPPTPTNSPTTTETSTSIPSPTPVPPSPTATPTPTIPAGTIILLKPTLEDESSTGPTVFEWQWSDQLETDKGFEVRVWRDGEFPAGVHDSVLDNKEGRITALRNNTYRLEVDITDAAGVKGRDGQYNWTVVLVQIGPEYKDLGIQASPPSRLHFNPPPVGGGGGGGNGNGTVIN